MEEQSKAQSSASKPFKSTASAQPDLVVQTDESDVSAPTPDYALASVAESHGQEEQTNKTADVKVAAKAFKAAKAPHSDSISQIGKSAAKVPPKGAEPIKKPMTPNRFFKFVCGLFIAGMAGSYSNALISAGIERFNAPQYVSQFHHAEVLQNRDQAFDGMQSALKEGEKLEPQSRRFANLTASLARQFDAAGRYIDAKSQWARAAVPSDIASPDLRERKRSFLINEAESDHLAFFAKMKDKVDLDLLKELENAGRIFKHSEVALHTFRAFDAFVAAGALHADNKNFAQAHEDFDRAQIVFEDEWKGLLFNTEALLKARWRAELQEVTAEMLAAKSKPVLRNQYKPSDWLALSQFADHDLKDRKFDRLNTAMDDAQKAHLQDVSGNTVVANMYLNLGHPWNSSETDEGRHLLLKDWAASRPRSARPLIALAYSLNNQADRLIGQPPYTTFSDDARSRGYQMLYEAAQDLHQALKLQPEVAYEPSFLEAIERNVRITEILSGRSYPTSTLTDDLHKVDIAMTGDEEQLFLDEISFDAAHNPHTTEFTKTLLGRALEQANKIGGDAGDEFYTRAVKRIAANRTFENVDRARYKKGESLLRATFGSFHGALP